MLLLLLLLCGHLHVCCATVSYCITSTCCSLAICMFAVLSESPASAAVLPVVAGAVYQSRLRALWHCSTLQGLPAAAASSPKD
jgi:hypothetical protein